MKKSRLARDTQKNASKLHIRVLELLVELFPNLNIQQEMKVSEVNPSFGSNRERYDLCIPEMNIVIEIQGEQHYQKVCFGGITEEQAKKNLLKRQEVDYLKEKAARDNGWGYVIVKYTEKKITKEELLTKINVAINDIIVPEEKIEKEKITINSNNTFKDLPKKKIYSNNKLHSRSFPKQEKKKWPKKKVWNKK